MAEQKPPQPKADLEPKYSPDVASLEKEMPNFSEIGGSPVPGLTLRHLLPRQKDWIDRIAWSPDGSYLASPSGKAIYIWDVARGECTVLEGHTDEVCSVAWSPNGLVLGSASRDSTVKTWDVNARKVLKTFTGHTEDLFAVAWSPDGRILTSGGRDTTVRNWDADSGKLLNVLTTHSGTVYDVPWSSDGKYLATADSDGIILIWDTLTWDEIKRFEGHKDLIHSLAWMPDSLILASGSGDSTIGLWDVTTGFQIRTIEGHTGLIKSISFSVDGKFLASKSTDQTVRVWRTDTWETVAKIVEPTIEIYAPGLAFHPSGEFLATLGDLDTIIRVWQIDSDVLLSHSTANSVPYTTAKLVLVGDSGVGKTGLGWRLAHGEFKEHFSTHGQQFWPITQLGLKRKDGTECEAVLWDLAGQHVYRQIHSIFLENVAAALVLFDPSNRQEPLKGAQFWLEQLKGKGQLPPAVLVGARVDRGAPAISQQELDQFCQRYGIRGGYISTSALKGEGLDTLLETLKAQIPWDEMTATVTTVTFKRIKDYVLALKEKPDRESVLVSPLALREQLQATDHEFRFTDPEMITAVAHLETHGYVAVLRSSEGEEHVLLTPELLVTLASSIVLLADKHPRELGAVNETELLQGKYPFDELAGLSATETQILLDAAILRFLEHNICFRETLGDETLLIFPGLIKQKRPLQDDLPSADDISYVVRGRVENLYASLVVLLGYTPSFTRINQWQNQAQYEMSEGEICGFRVIEDREGEIEVVLYYGDRLPAHGRTQFQELFEQFLYQRDVEVTRFPPVVCANKHQQKRATVIERVRERKPFMFCDECGDKIELPDFDEPQTAGIGASQWLQREEAIARFRSAYEVQLTRVKGYRRNWAAPRCYLSHLPQQSEWVAELIHDLRAAGVYIVEQSAQVQPDDFVIVLDTPAYKKAFETSAPALATDKPLVRARLGKRQLISLSLSGQGAPHELKDCTFGDFADDTHYPMGLFDLVLNLYAIPFTHAGFEPVRQGLHAHWEQKLAGKKIEKVNSPLKLFISYSHKDEEFKDELITMLTGLQRQAVIDAWQDRRIEEGAEWYQAIQDVMNECDLAILLVSQHFIASRFIQDDELPRLLQRRREHGLRVVPIIVRPCKWQSEPMLKDLQALPKDGKPVIKFSKDNGDRDQVWEEIATAIEERAKTKTTGE